MLKRLLCIAIAFVCVLFISPTSSFAEEGNDYYFGIDDSGNKAYMVLDSVTEYKRTKKRKNGYFFYGYKYELKVKSVVPDTQEWHYDNYDVYVQPGGKSPWGIKKGDKWYYLHTTPKGQAEYNIGDYFLEYVVRYHSLQLKKAPYVISENVKEIEECNWH